MAYDSKKIFDLTDKVIILTGGAGFLGTHYARALADAGARVALWDRRDEFPAKDAGFAQKVDITDETQVKDAVAAVLKKWGRLDGLINNAAMNPAVGSDDAKKQFVPYEEYPIELWEQELKVNLTGMMICTKAVAPVMMSQKNGSIVNIASEVSAIAHDHRVYNDLENRRFKSIAYTTTKTAVLGFTRQWAARLGRHSVRVNSFSLGGVQTEKMPADFVARFGDANMLGRMAHADEYNGAIVFLCSDASSFMTGSNLTADGGKSAW
jgi:NAD(P)-dependent dehydrogenase (short-subunit alcohol dehydrogenase family)